MHHWSFSPRQPPLKMPPTGGAAGYGNSAGASAQLTEAGSAVYQNGQTGSAVKLMEELERAKREGKPESNLVSWSQFARGLTIITTVD